MAAKLFGTDGVRGVAGTELTAEIALALGRAGAMESAAARPQVLIVRDTRESGPMLEAALAAGVAEGGGDAWLGGVLPTPAASILAPPARPRPRRGGLRVPQPLAAQRGQVLRRGWAQAGRRRGGAESRPGSPRAARRRGRPWEGSASWTGRSTTTGGRCSRPSGWTSPDAACCSTARTGRPTGRRPRSSSGWGRRWRRSPWSPTGATSTRAAARPTRSCWPRPSAEAARRSASPSTATATG